jgi:hypothetical protein
MTSKSTHHKFAARENDLNVYGNNNTKKGKQAKALLILIKFCAGRQSLLEKKWR